MGFLLPRAGDAVRFRLKAGPPVVAFQILADKPLPRFVTQTNMGIKVFTSHFGQVDAKWGDWVVIDEHSHVSHVGAFMFAHLYEAVP